MKTLDACWIGLLIVGGCTAEQRPVVPAQPAAAGMAGSSGAMRETGGTVAPTPPRPPMVEEAGSAGMEAPPMGGRSAEPVAGAESPDAAVPDAMAPLADAAVTDGGIEATDEVVRVVARGDGHPVSLAHVLVHDADRKLFAVYETDAEGKAAIELPALGSVTVAYEARYKFDDSTVLARTIRTYEEVPAGTKIVFFVEDPPDAVSQPAGWRGYTRALVELQLPQGTTGIATQSNCSGLYQEPTVKTQLDLDISNCDGDYDLIVTAYADGHRYYGAVLDNPSVREATVTHHIAVNRQDYVERRVQLGSQENASATLTLMGQRNGSRWFEGDLLSASNGNSISSWVSIEAVFDRLRLRGNLTRELPDEIHVSASLERTGSGSDLPDNVSWWPGEVAQPVAPIGRPSAAGGSELLNWTLDPKGTLHDAMMLVIGEWQVLRPPLYTGSLKPIEWPAELATLAPTIAADSNWRIRHYDFVDYVSYQGVLEHLDEDFLQWPENADFATASQCPRCN